MTQEIDQYRNKILQGDCLSVLKTLPSKSIQMCVTSPPYYALREYGTAKWEGGDINCDHIEINSLRRDSPGGFHNSEARGSQPNTVSVQKQYRDTCGKCGAKRIDAQIGQEKTLEGYVQKMREVFGEVKRVLRDDGVLWLNLGDSYAGSGVHAAHHKNPGMSNAPHRGADVATPIPQGLKAKDMCGVPWRVAFALQDDGYWLRNDAIWCLSGGLEIYVKSQKGVMPMMIKDFAKLDMSTVQLWNGNKWVSVKSITRSNTKQGLQIELRSGERIGCTHNHIWPTNNGLKKTSELIIG
jgi:hypothetical protein